MAVPPRIIIADDDLSDRYLLKTAFDEASVVAQITECEDGAELIDLLVEKGKTEPPCLILLDLNMPKRTGLDVLEFLKEHPDVCRSPVIILSTSSNLNDMMKAKELGAVDYLVKPNDYLGYIEIAKTLNKYLSAC